MHTDLVRLTIKGISFSQSNTGAYALILSTLDDSKKIPIVIGGYEAQSIAIAMEKDLIPSRPLTHDLFKNFALRYNISIRYVVIHKLVDGVFFSNILFVQENGKEELIDARTSDAIALAIRFGVPIYTYQNIVDTAGIYLNINSKDSQDEDDMPLIVEETNQPQTDNPYAKYSKEELLQMLEDAVAQEDYQKAVELRDEISKR
ncbi:MAG: bifunctional nuclease family protein [Bacteroidota bacterium]|nr:bifunctional nuclease family protein [Bacteroidota bacterium]